MSAESADKYFRMVNASKRTSFRTGPVQTATRIADHKVAVGDEDYAHTYVKVQRDTGRVLINNMLVGTLDGLSATVAATGATVTGKTRRAVLTALALAHNAHIDAARQQH